MPHFECGAFNRSATSPEPKKSLKKPVLCGRYLTKRAKRDKRQTGLWRRILCARIKSRLLAGKTMRDALKFDRIRKEMPGVLITLALVGGLTAVLFTMVWEFGLEHGSVVYPVSYTHLRAHETVLDLVCRLLLENNK